MFPNSLKKIIDNFKKFPGIGTKTAERLGFSLFDFSKDQLSEFSDALLEFRDKICYCSVCGNISEGNFCSICSDSTRNSEIILIVERPKDVFLFEKIGVYKGMYHILNGLISPIEGIGPDDINLSNLIDRLKFGEIKEIIFGLKPNIEGETTIQYIKKIINDLNLEVKISKLAIGVPIGTDMEYIDALTLELAIDERKNVN